MKSPFLFTIFLFVIVESLCHAQNPLLWGMTSAGGVSHIGTIFNYDVNAATETDNHDFAGGPNDGWGPGGDLLKANNGLLYGLTQSGGDNSNQGTIFSYNISTGTETVLHNFGSDTDGADPRGSLIQANDDLLYGMTNSGGSYGHGILFSYNILTGVETDLHDFGNGTDGTNPEGSPIQASNGLIYGVVGTGGANGGGILYSYNISTGIYTKLYDFGNGMNVYDPQGSLVQLSDGLLYGISVGGGTNGGYGTIFSYNIITGKDTVLHSFGSGTDGTFPLHDKLLQASDSLLYGMTQSGGVYSRGIIFNYNITSGIETDVHDFGSDTDGKQPFASLIQASNGLLYGMTSLGGANSNGIIFNYNITTGIETDIHDFGNGTDGKTPDGSLTEVDTIGVTPIIASICTGGSVTLKASGATTYTWSPATGLSATTGDSVIATPTVTITYTVIGIIGTAGTSYAQTDSTTVTVTVNMPPTITVNTPSPICNGGNATLIANGGSTYTWSPSTALNATTGDSVIASPTATTIYTVTGDSLGCTATATDTVKVITAPPLPIVPASAFLCLGQSDTLFAQGTGNNFTWSPSSGLSATTGSSVIATPTVTTTYSVTGPDSLGCTATGTVVVTIFPSPNQPSFIQSGDTLISSSQHDNQWYYNGAPLNNDTSQRLIITVPGEYWVVVNNEANGCSTASDSMKVDTVTGIEQLTVNSGQLTIYPNPTSGQFTIKLNDNQNGYTVEVYNVMGEKVYQSVLNNSQNDIDLSSQSTGMYFVYLKSAEGVEVGKVLVTK